MTPRAAWIGCAAAGVVAFACSWLFGQIPGLVACGPTGGLGPIIAFEFVKAPADVAALFGEECRRDLIVAQRVALGLDGLGFIPAYTAFLIFGAAATGARGWIKWALIAILAFAGLFDEIEGYVLRQVLESMPGTSDQIGLLSGIVHTKFALLAIGTAGIGAMLLAGRRRFAILPAIWLAAWALHALQSLAQSSQAQMMTAFAVAWVSLLVIAITAAWRPSLFSPAASSPAHAGLPPVPATPSA